LSIDNWQSTDEFLSIKKRKNETGTNQSLTQMALSWLLKDKRATSVLIGVSSVDQLENNLGCLDNLKFSAEELSSIENILKGAQG